jgi:hypothetical protein
MRFCMLLLLLGAAAVFDMHHTVNKTLADRIHRIPPHDETGSGKIFFCNQLPSFNLKISSSEWPFRFRFACTHDKFLLKHYNLRTFQILKAEQENHSVPSFFAACHSHLVRLRYSVPDDTPPLS